MGGGVPQKDARHENRSRGVAMMPYWFYFLCAVSAVILAVAVATGYYGEYDD